MDEQGFHQQIDPVVLRLARFKSRQLAGKYGFERQGAEDIQQELLADYLQRSGSFDPRRCNRRTFERLVVNNRVASLIEAQKAACRDYRVCLMSLDQSLDDQDGSDSPKIDHILVSRASLGYRQSLELKLNLRLDVERILIRLPTRLMSVCRLLMVCDSAMDVAAKAGISRATLYRRLGQVRAAFMEAGLGG